MANGLLTGLIICFPFYLWFAGWDYPLATSIYLLIAGSLRFIAGLHTARSSADWLMILASIALGLLVLALGAVVGLYYPVVINLGLLLLFYASLSTPKNFIQRIAENIEKHPLDSVGIKYTGYVTRIWCVVFLLNAIISTLLAWFQMLDKWTLYNGVVAYLVIAFLFLGERSVRHRIQQKMRRSDDLTGGCHD